jgi:hypothetical protein
MFLILGFVGLEVAYDLGFICVHTKLLIGPFASKKNRRSLESGGKEKLLQLNTLLIFSEIFYRNRTYNFCLCNL